MKRKKRKQVKINFRYFFLLSKYCQNFLKIDKKLEICQNVWKWPLFDIQTCVSASFFDEFQWNLLARSRETSAELHAKPWPSWRPASSSASRSCRGTRSGPPAPGSGPGWRRSSRLGARNLSRIQANANTDNLLLEFFDLIIYWRFFACLYFIFRKCQIYHGDPVYPETSIPMCKS